MYVSIGTPSERATLRSNSSRTSNRRLLSNRTLGQKVIFICCFGLFVVVFLVDNDTLTLPLTVRYLWRLLTGGEIPEWSGLLRLGVYRTDPPRRHPAQTRPSPPPRLLSPPSHVACVVNLPLFFVLSSLCSQIFWSDSGELVCIAADESFFVLRYLPEKVAAAMESETEMTQDGMEGAFEVGLFFYLFIFHLRLQ